MAGCTKWQSWASGSVADVPVQVAGTETPAKRTRAESQTAGAGPDRQSHNIGFYICSNNKINTVMVSAGR